MTGQKLINDQQSRSSNPDRNFINTNHNLLHHHQHNSKVIRETPKIINSTECIPQPDSNSQASSVSSSRESSDSCDCIVHQVGRRENFFIYAYVYLCSEWLIYIESALLLTVLIRYNGF